MKAARPRTASDALSLRDGPRGTTAPRERGRPLPGARPAQAPHRGPERAGGSSFPAPGVSESRFLFSPGTAKDTSPAASVCLSSRSDWLPPADETWEQMETEGNLSGRLTQRGGLGTDAGAGGGSRVRAPLGHGGTRPPPRKRPPWSCGPRPGDRPPLPWRCGGDEARHRPLHPRVAPPQAWWPRCQGCRGVAAVCPPALPVGAACLTRSRVPSPCDGRAVPYRPPSEGWGMPPPHPHGSACHLPWTAGRQEGHAARRTMPWWTSAGRARLCPRGTASGGRVPGADQ